MLGVRDKVTRAVHTSYCIYMIRDHISTCAFRVARTFDIGWYSLYLVPELGLLHKSERTKRQCSASESKTEKLGITTGSSSNVTAQMGRQRP